MNFIFLFHSKARLFFLIFSILSGCFVPENTDFVISRVWQHRRNCWWIHHNDSSSICTYQIINGISYCILSQWKILSTNQKLSHIKPQIKKTTTINFVKNHDIMKIAAISRHWDSLIQAQGYFSHHQEYLLRVFSK